MGSPLADLQNSSPEIQIYLRPLLSVEGHFKRAVRVLPEGKVRRPEPDSQVEEAGIREPLLPAMHPNQRHKFRHQLHLQSAKTEARRGENRRVCSLWLPGVFRVAPIQVYWCGIALGTNARFSSNYYHKLYLSFKFNL